MPRPDLGRRPLEVRLLPQARAMLGERPCERARQVLEGWARDQAASVTRDELEALMAACAATGDGEGVGLCGRALAADEGSADWCRAAELALRLREE